MRPLGTHKTRTHVAGHQDCGDCHPPQKGGRAAEERRAKIEVYQEIRYASWSPNWRVLECHHADFPGCGCG